MFGFDTFYIDWLTQKLFSEIFLAFVWKYSTLKNANIYSKEVNQRIRWNTCRVWCTLPWHCGCTWACSGSRPCKPSDSWGRKGWVNRKSVDKTVRTEGRPHACHIVELKIRCNFNFNKYSNKITLYITFHRIQTNTKSCQKGQNDDELHRETLEMWLYRCLENLGVYILWFVHKQYCREAVVFECGDIWKHMTNIRSKDWMLLDFDEQVG